ncbi:hypothetical protein [Candidatus Halobonum tyrrellensis]|uniref:hypothetical protein n=1 Tax=Candidatus Halobonum tyrrellensis TaxID=1431545 RepID=UPI00190FAF89|nr:hypothetical protein [Candidatus Halobonum tyrrellensis]
MYEEPLRFFGTRINRLMTVIRLTDGSLFAQSPAELTPAVKKALDELGPVKFVVPTSKLHGHLYMEQYRDAYPDVKLFAAPGLPARHLDVRFDGLLGSTPDPRWSADIDQVALMGTGGLPNSPATTVRAVRSSSETSATISPARVQSRCGFSGASVGSTTGSGNPSNTSSP